MKKTLACAASAALLPLMLSAAPATADRPIVPQKSKGTTARVIGQYCNTESGLGTARVRVRNHTQKTKAVNYLATTQEPPNPRGYGDVILEPGGTKVLKVKFPDEYTLQFKVWRGTGLDKGRLILNHTFECPVS